MLRTCTRILLVYSLLGLLSLAPLSCGGGRTGLGVTQPGGDVAPGSVPPSKVLPLDGGVCAGGTSLCGSGAGARCYALDSDPMNCGACGQACTPGVACSAGTCQQAKCTGPVSFQQIGSFPSILWTPEVMASGDSSRYVDYWGADMNRDGRLDLLESNQGGDLVIWLGHGDGTFSASTTYATSGSFDTWALPGYAAVGDYNEDGLADLAVTIPNSDKVEIRTGIPGGGLGGQPGGPFSRLLMADLDGDGHLDVIEKQVERSKDGIIPRGFTVLRGRGDGTFANGGDYSNSGDDPWSPSEILDWDGDGTLDLIAGASALSVLKGKGDGTFAQPQRCAPGTGGWLIDLNRDGKYDAVWALGQGPAMTVVLGLGNCNFLPRTDYRLSFQPGAFRIGDVTGDGVPDLVISAGYVGGTAPNRMALLIGKGDGSFVAQPELALDMSGFALFIADVTDDGLPDIISTGDRGIIVFANTCAH